jgi:hypothetical protein
MGGLLRLADGGKRSQITGSTLNLAVDAAVLECHCIDR